MENKIEDSRILINDINSPIRKVYKIPIENIKPKKWWQFWKKDILTLYREELTLVEEKKPDIWNIVGITNQYDMKLSIPIPNNDISIEDAEKEIAKLISNYSEEIKFDENTGEVILNKHNNMPLTKDICMCTYSDEIEITEPIDTSNIVGIFAINHCYDISTLDRMLVDITSEKNIFGIPYDILSDNENECNWFIFYTSKITLDKKAIIHNILENEPSKFWE